MHKLCYLIVLYFVVQIALGNADEDGFTHNYSDSNEEFTATVTDKNVVFEERVSTPTIEHKTLQQLDSLEDGVKSLVKEIARIDTMNVSQKSAINKTNAYPQNCREATTLTNYSGIYVIQVEKYGSEPFKVFCEQELFDGGWIVVARRMNGSAYFNRNWMDYKHGFGDLDGEFFIGMEKLYALTNGPQSQELIFVLEDFENKQKFEKYSVFAMGDESEGYFIKALDYYSGNAAGSFSMLLNITFKTKDRDKDSNILGWRITRGYWTIRGYKGVIWYHPSDPHYSFKLVQMMIRSRNT